jgi:predicted transcriptional regulator
MVRETEGIGLSRPTFHYVDGHFKIILQGPSDILKIKSQDARPIFELAKPLLDNLSTTQKAILKVLLTNENVRVMMLADTLSLSRQAIQKALKPMIDSGIVVKSGKARDTIYRLAEAGGE